MINSFKNGPLTDNNLIWEELDCHFTYVEKTSKEKQRELLKSHSRKSKSNYELVRDFGAIKLKLGGTNDFWLNPILCNAA